eukprot:TRINITY_DN35677_c0_g1_i2.p1 TRINITY_DN35677_c0_g1~~TRINITY_DN35677_c0_g1_i2.p1  ORF type:complete len:503 (+),score=71.17 TRINITY_DN35677_c0_g1_i2:116-1510(+)
MAQPPFFASSPSPLGSLRAAAGQKVAAALLPATPRGLRAKVEHREGVVGFRSSSCRQTPRPLGSSHCSAGVTTAGSLIARPGSARSSLQAAALELGWPAELVLAAGVGIRGLVPRGTLFEYHCSCPAEPRRSGSYQFCVVGLDVSRAGQPGYFAWEPTGYFDRRFSCDELEQRLALQRTGRSVGGVHEKRQDLDLQHSHCQAVLPAGHAVRWPAADSQGSLVHCGLLPAVGCNGRPYLHTNCKFQPRTSADLLGPAMQEWQRRFLPSLRSRLQKEQHHPLRLLVLEGTGRLARMLQDTLEGFEVTAADDPHLRCKRPLRTLRGRSHLQIDTELLSCAEPVIHTADDHFDVVLMPFVLQRLCSADVRRLLMLWREGLRCCRGHLLLAEDLVEPASETALGSWKGLLQAEWSSAVLLDIELRAGKVGDHFLSGVDHDGQRRFLIVDASTFRDNREARGTLPPRMLQ